MPIPDFKKQYIQNVNEKQAEFMRLIQAKAEKMTNIHLEKDRHTQLSYLSKEEQEYEVALAREAILNKFTSLINRL